MLRLLAVGLLATVAVCATSATSTGEGIVGAFTLLYSRHQPQNPTPSLEVTVEGTFAVQDGSFLAELAYPLPGGGEEKIGLLMRSEGKQAYLLYPETLNYREIHHKDGAWHLFELVPSAAEAYFGAAKEALKKRGVQLSYLGLRDVNGEQLRAYAISMEGGFPLEVKDAESAKWNLTLYFADAPERLRAAQAKSGESEVRITISGVRREEVPASRYEVPGGYFALEPLIISEEAPPVESDA